MAARPDIAYTPHLLHLLRVFCPALCAGPMSSAAKLYQLPASLGKVQHIRTDMDAALYLYWLNRDGVGLSLSTCLQRELLLRQAVVRLFKWGEGPAAALLQTAFAVAERAGGERAIRAHWHQWVALMAATERETRRRCSEEAAVAAYDATRPLKRPRALPNEDDDGGEPDEGGEDDGGEPDAEDTSATSAASL